MFRSPKFIFAAALVCFLFAGSWNFARAQVAIDPLLKPPGASTVTGQEPSTEGETAEARSQGAAGEYSEQATRILLLERITSFILGLAGVVAIFFIINNAWFLIASGGSEETITQHKKGLMWAVVGLILIILSYSIIRFIISIPFQAGEGSSPAAGETPVAGAS